MEVAVIPSAAPCTAICGGCGGPYRFDTSVPSVLWNRVIRPLGGSEYLCLTCVVAKFAKAGMSFTAELCGADFDGLPVSIEFNGAASSVIADLNAENNRLRSRLRECSIRNPAGPDWVAEFTSAQPGGQLS